MSIRKIFQVALIFLFCLFSSAMFAYPSHAARIYNLTDKEISVVGVGTDIGLVRDFARLFESRRYPSVRLAPGERSGSLSWDAHGVQVQSQGRVFSCSLDFNLRNEIVGGNYMIVRPGGECVVCSSTRQVIAGSGSCS